MDTACGVELVTFVTFLKYKVMPKVSLPNRVGVNDEFDESICINCMFCMDILDIQGV